MTTARELMTPDATCVGADDDARSLPDPRSANPSKRSPADTRARVAGRELGTPSAFVTEEA
ncbi:hypothetical protein ABTX77_26900 [Streptomyces sp. NPDC097704]|uniref:hypothetical protein n=1 Tax=Streptomyces sp. NPDC097704 TaxID=3157101 RepID=UPI003328D336